MNSRRTEKQLFGDMVRGRQIALVLVAPIVFGIVAGLTLGWSSIAWWVLQVLGILGAVSSGAEHLGWKPAAVRGAVAGILFGLTILVIRDLTPAPDAASFGDPAVFPFIAAIIAAGLHMIGSARRRRQQRKSVDAAAA